MRAPTIDITLDTCDVQPGDEVTGTIRLQPDNKLKSVRVQLLELDRFNVGWASSTPTGALFHVCTGDVPNCDAGIGEVAHGSQDLAATDGEQRFTLTVPVDAPPTAFDPTRPEELRQLVSWQVRVTASRGWVGETHFQTDLQVRSPFAEYAAWADEQPTVKSKKCPIGVWPATRVLRPGDEVAGTVVVTPQESFAVKRTSALLAYRRKDQGPSARTAPWRNDTACELSGPTHYEAGQTYTYPFLLRIPEDAPPSYATPNTDLHWYVAAEVDATGLFGKEHRGESQIVVHTGGDGGTAATATHLVAAGSVDDLVAFVSAAPPASHSDRDLEEQKREAVRKIAHSGDPRAVTALISLLNVDTGFLPKLSTTEHTVRCTVIEQLGELRDPQAVDPLLALLHADAASWREPGGTDNSKQMILHSMASSRFKAAAHALALIGDQRAIPDLTEEAADQGNVFIRKAAKKAAADISGRSATTHPGR